MSVPIRGLQRRQQRSLGETATLLDILTGAILLKLTAIAIATVSSEGERYQEGIKFLRRFIRVLS
ncbi:hypothetical protein YC2023_064753 [Brassica napus]